MRKITAVGRDHRRPHRAGRRLRDELRLHARAALEVRVSAGGGHNSGDLPAPLPNIQKEPMALALRRTSTFFPPTRGTGVCDATTPADQPQVLGARVALVWIVL